MAVKEPPLCDLCKKPKVKLKERLDITGGEIFVCTSMVASRKMPCDGWIGRTAKLQL